MATVKFSNKTIKARPIQQLENGDWLMEAQESGPRYSHGTRLRIKASEVVEIAAAELPAENP